MPTHDIIVIGASAGGVETLSRFVEALPPDLPASIFIVLHTSPQSRGLLPTVLGKSSTLTVLSANDKLAFQPKHIYIAPPDSHLLLEQRWMRVVRGPKENRHRPAIDPLFRSAAWAFGPRVVGIVMSGMLDDGAAGLWSIKTCGGTTIVQDPSEAIFPDMPANAMLSSDVDHCLPLSDIVTLVTTLAHTSVPESVKYPVPDRIKTETEFAMMQRDINDMEKFAAQPSPFTCPSCNGALWELQDGDLLRYRCHVGHAFSVESLLEEQTEALESALYSALRAMEEKAAALRRTAKLVGERMPEQKVRYETRAAEKDQSADVIRRLLAGSNLSNARRAKENHGGK